MQHDSTDYDYVILGAGIGGLATAAQLALAGLKVLVLDRHSTVGGYAHSFDVGGYSFCHQVQYLMGCEPGGPMPKFLGRLGLDDLKFNFMDEAGYDVVVSPTLRFEIPSTLVAFEQRMVERFPAHAAGIHRYFALTRQVHAEGRSYERILDWRDVARAPWRYRNVLKAMPRTLEEVFQRLNLPEEVRLVLAGQAGNLAVPPRDASFLMHSGMQVSYSLSAAYPKLGMADMIARIRDCIAESPGCRVLTDTEVTRIVREGDRIVAVETSAGRFRGQNFVSNLDPQRTYDLMAPRPIRRVRSYDYSSAVFSLYLGIKGVKPAAHGLGKRNFWFHSHHDINREFDDLTKKQRFDEPWVFISTPSLLADPGALCRPDQFSLVALTFVNYADWRRLLETDVKAYEKRSTELKNRMYEILDRHFLPDIRRHVEVEHVETPREVAKKLAPPNNAVYGAELTPSTYNLRRISKRTGLTNLSLVGATSCYPGIMPIVVGSMQLVDQLLKGRAIVPRPQNKKYSVAG